MALKVPSTCVSRPALRYYDCGQTDPGDTPTSVRRLLELDNVILETQADPELASTEK